MRPRRNHERAVGISVRAYRSLLRAYPRKFRDEYGDEMVRCFRDLCRDELRDGGRFGLAALWARSIKDLLVAALRERLDILDKYAYRSILRVAIVTGLILLIPLVAMQFTDEVDWNLFDFAAAGTLLFGTGCVFVLAVRKTRDIRHQATIGIVLAAALVYVWLELAVGVFTNLGS